MGRNRHSVPEMKIENREYSDFYKVSLNGNRIQLVRFIFTIRLSSLLYCRQFQSFRLLFGHRLVSLRSPNKMFCRSLHSLPLPQFSCVCCSTVILFIFMCFFVWHSLKDIFINSQNGNLLQTIKQTNIETVFNDHVSVIHHFFWLEAYHFPWQMDNWLKFSFFFWRKTSLLLLLSIPWKLIYWQSVFSVNWKL